MENKNLKLIISLDGGGVRGSFDLDIIHSIESHFNKKIYDIFDMVIGVSTGSATAATIATKLYENDIRNTYTTRHSDLVFFKHQSNGVLSTKYDGTGKTELLSTTYGNRTLGSIEYPMAILTATINGDPVLFNTWSPEYNKIKLKDVVNASTAAPVYFPPVRINGTYYIDGGTVSNDPVLAGIFMAKKKWGNDVKLAVLSLGTGKASDINIVDHENHPLQFGLLRWLSEGLITILTRSNDTLFDDVIPLIIGKDNYLRINSTVVGNLDDTSCNMKEALSKNAEEIWRHYKIPIVEWLHSKIREKTSPIQ